MGEKKTAEPEWQKLGRFLGFRRYPHFGTPRVEIGLREVGGEEYSSLVALSEADLEALRTVL